LGRAKRGKKDKKCSHENIVKKEKVERAGKSAHVPERIVQD